jgi:glycosyltransferase involved in cell wall biosynthesis
VAFDVGGNADIISHLNAGNIAQPRSASDLGHGIARLLTDPAWLATARPLCTHNIRDHFTLDHHARSYMKLYEQVIEASACIRTAEACAAT